MSRDVKKMKSLQLTPLPERYEEMLAQDSRKSSEVFERTVNNSKQKWKQWIFNSPVGTEVKLCKLGGEAGRWKCTEENDFVQLNFHLRKQKFKEH